MKTIQKILGISVLTGTLLWGSATLAQFGGGRSFLFPSASFFSPSANPWESEDASLFSLLKQQHKTLHSYMGEDFIVENQGNYITVLAPTDEAFANLPEDVKAKLEDPENLEELLKYHLIAGKITEEDIKRQAVATMLDQTSVSITGIQEGDTIGVKLNDAKAAEPNGDFSDGVIIPIDQVLIPPGF